MLILVKRIKESIAKWVKPLSNITSTIGASALMLMMFLMVVDVVGRYFFNHPIAGSYELIVYLMVLVVFFGLGYAQLKKMHVKVEILLYYVGDKGKAVIESITLFLSLIILGVITWAAFIQTKDVIAANRLSEILYIPQWPFQLLTAVGALVFTLALLVDFLDAVSRIGGIDGK